MDIYKILTPGQALTKLQQGRTIQISIFDPFNDSLKDWIDAKLISNRLMVKLNESLLWNSFNDLRCFLGSAFRIKK